MHTKGHKHVDNLEREITIQPKPHIVAKQQTPHAKKGQEKIEMRDMRIKKGGTERERAKEEGREGVEKNEDRSR